VTLGVLVLGLLVAACLWILQPFLGALVWATLIVVATWPMLLAVQSRLGGRRGPAVAILTLSMVLVVVLPVGFAVASIIDHVDALADLARRASTLTLPPAPDWLLRVPLAGRALTRQWNEFAAFAHEDLVAYAAPYARAALEWFTTQIGGLGRLAIHFLLTVIITAALYASGEQAAEGVRRFAQRLAGDRGDRALTLAGQAIRAVALGILVTAITQSAIAGIGLAVCGVPYAAVLTAITFVLCLIQLGPVLVMIPAVAWVYWSGHTGWGTVLLVWSIVVAGMDNVIRPILIRRGADLPLPLIILGAIGGLIGFGVIGLFVGPVVLAVTYRLIEWWIADIDQEPVGSGMP
jgi:predicted PurR-regulated permease PerM